MDFALSYLIITILTIICFIGVAFIFPFILPMRCKQRTLLVLFLITGLFSYGFLFELERGQFNLIAFALCFFGLYIFHNNNKYRWLAYLLFTLSIQLKIYPAIFIVLFVLDWKDIRGTIKRFAGLGFVNIALLFIFGFGVFKDFINALHLKVNDSLFWVGNFSIHSFVQFWVPSALLKYFHIPTSYFGDTLKIFVESTLIFLVLILFAIELIITIRKRTPGIDPLLLFSCTCVALLLPPVSHDYKLSLLVGPTAFFLKSIRIGSSYFLGVKILIFFLVFIFSSLFFSTEYSYFQKSPLIANNFVAVFTMMAISVALYFIDLYQENKIPHDRIVYPDTNIYSDETLR